MSLVAGHGSIGKRHARLPAEDGHQEALVSSPKALPLPHFPTLSQALEHSTYDHIGVATPTALHKEGLEIVRLIDAMERAATRKSWETP